MEEQLKKEETTNTQFEMEEKNKERVEQIQEIVQSIVDKYCQDLDNVINTIKGIIKSTIPPSDAEIEDILFGLPVYIYQALDGQEFIGISGDIAKQVKQEAYSKAHKLARGTIADKDTQADIASRQQQIEYIIYDRAYKLIKAKVEAAYELLQGVKKIHAKRMQEYNMNKFNNRI